jgi:hypothetical protein
MPLNRDHASNKKSHPLVSWMALVNYFVAAWNNDNRFCLAKRY